MKTLRIVLLLVLFTAFMAQPAVASKKTTDAGAALLASLFIESVKKFVVLHDFHFSSYEMPNGNVRYWVTVIYKDETDSGAEVSLCKVLAMCQVLAEKGKLDLAEVEMRPMKGGYNPRASLIARFRDNEEAAANWVALFTGKPKLSTEQKRAATRWMNSWTVRQFDPRWRAPNINR